MARARRRRGESERYQGQEGPRETPGPR
jgi:hypothetical protein